jgi:hypothetical protein
MGARALGYGAVLALVMASIVMQMTVAGSDAIRLATIALQAGTLVAAVRASRLRRGGVRLAALAAVAAVVAAAVTWVLRSDIPESATAVVNGLLVAVAPLAIGAGLFDELRSTRRVTLATLAGVLAIYLLVGMLFSSVYGVIAAVDPGALYAGEPDPNRSDQLYFSFVTLCTVGYGDLVPASDGSRTLAVTEMLLGQIYLVTVVALMVGNLRPRDRPAERHGV